MMRRPANVTRRRVAAHACPDCRRLWALRGVRTDDGTWLISCAHCGWHDLRGAGVERGPGVPGQRGTAPAGGQWSHGVLLYDEDEQLLGTLEAYLLAGWSEGAVGLVIATAEHRRGLRARLIAHGLTALLSEGRFVELDAAETLALFMRDGAPDPELFDRTVGALVREHATDGALRGFGEMVDVLWAEGNAVGALELERLWSALGRRVSFTLLCAYATAHVDPEDRAAVVAAHEHALP
jgi:hypothetical protein